MASFSDELVRVAKTLVERKAGQKGKLTQARIRRSISTSYYALFHFVTSEVGQHLVGSLNPHTTRRRVLARSVTHIGIKLAFDRVRQPNFDQVYAAFFQPAQNSPRFARSLARTFIDAQKKRHAADYDLNEKLSGGDAEVLIAGVEDAMRQWRDAKTRDDKHFKAALCMLITLGGKLRSE